VYWLWHKPLSQADAEKALSSFASRGACLHPPRADGPLDSITGTAGRRRPNGAPRWRCKACRKDFSVTSGTLFAFHKLPLRSYLLAIAIFCNEVKGKSMLAMSRDLGVQYKTSFVLAHKMREAMASELRGINIGGEGRKAEIDGAYFGGYVKPANRVENRRDRRLRQNQSGKRKTVVVIRERDGKTLPGVSPRKSPRSTSFAPGSPGAPKFMPTKAVRGTNCTAASRCTASIIKRRTALAMASTATTRRVFSAACAGPRSGTIITSRVRTSSVSRKRLHGARIIGATRTASILLPESFWAKHQGPVSRMGFRYHMSLAHRARLLSF
jgi:hypothetical protein